MRAELVVSTYNSPHSLRLTLLSTTLQRRLPDSICIADDGSGPRTKETIDAFAAEFPGLALRHVWHPDRGFEKNAILNKVVKSSDADLMIFTEGDCLMHPGFVARHVELAHPKRFACGSLIRLNAGATATVTENDVRSGHYFAHDWLRAMGAFDRLTTRLKGGLLSIPLSSLLELTSPVRRTWSGSNASACRAAIVAVNGFDEDMKYGGEDKEFGMRLANSGVHGRHLRFTAPLVHLDHPRGYIDPDCIRINRRRIAERRRNRNHWTSDGLVKGQPK